VSAALCRGRATHLPRRTNRVPRHGRIVERVSPCFPGYLFILLDVSGEAWKNACYTRGVARLLPISDNPIAVRTDEVLELPSGRARRRAGLRSGQAGLKAARLSRRACPAGD
jgi:transcription antitermination factor NusG